MRFVGQFLIFDLSIGVADLLGAGGTTTQRRAAIFGQRNSVMTGHLIFAYTFLLIFACQLARPKKAIFWDTLTLSQVSH